MAVSAKKIPTITKEELNYLLSLIRENKDDNTNNGILVKKLEKLSILRERIENPFGHIPNIRPWFRHIGNISPTKRDEKWEDFTVPHYVKIKNTSRLTKHHIVDSVDGNGVVKWGIGYEQYNDLSHICYGSTHCIIEYINPENKEVNYYYGYSKCSITEERFNKSLGIQKAFKFARLAQKYKVNITNEILELQKSLTMPSNDAKLEAFRLYVNNNLELSIASNEDIYNVLSKYNQKKAQNTINEVVNNVIN